MSILQNDVPVSSFRNHATREKKKERKSTGMSALSSSLKVWQLWHPGGGNDGVDPTASPAMSYSCLCVCVWHLYIYIIYI